MFNSQIPNKRVINPYIQMQPYPDMNMYQTPMTQEAYYNDNRSLYSASTQISSQTAINTNIKKRLNDEINSVLSGCIENILPKLVEECAENIYLRFSLEFDKQSKDIEEMKTQITGFQEKVNKRCLIGKNSTPLKNLKKVNDDLAYVNTLVKEQNEKLDDMKGGQSEDIVENVKMYMLRLKENFEAEKRVAEKMNNSLKEKNVDIVGMKRLVENKFTILSEKMKNVNPNAFQAGILSNVNSNRSKFEEILGMLNSINEKTAKQKMYQYQRIETDVHDLKRSEQPEVSIANIDSPKRKENISVNNPFFPTKPHTSKPIAVNKPVLLATKQVPRPAKKAEPEKRKNPFLTCCDFAF
jgi:hypothetical protein